MPSVWEIVIVAVCLFFAVRALRRNPAMVPWCAGLVGVCLFAGTFFIAFTDRPVPPRAPLAPATTVVVAAPRADLSTSVDSRQIVVENVPNTEPRPGVVVPEAESGPQAVLPEIGSSVIARTPLPEWVSQPVTVQDDTTLVVVSSGQYTSEEDADRKAMDAAADRVTRYLWEKHPELSGWHANSSHVENYVYQRAVETQIRDFGSIQAPMYRVHLQVAVSPELVARTRDDWRKATVEQRMRLMLGGIGALTVVLGGASVFLRRRPRAVRAAEPSHAGGADNRTARL